MNDIEVAAIAGAVAALFTCLNTALITWGNRQRTRQNAKLAEKVAAVHKDVTTITNGHTSK